MQQEHQGKSEFVLSGQPLLLITSNKPQACTGQLLFDVSSTRAPTGFAWLGSGRLAGPNAAHHLPFAKVSSVWQPPASVDSLAKALLSEEPDEPQGPKRGHTDEWYQQRCVFCASCKSTINSHYQKRGSRCQGCRRWFHAACMPATASSSNSSSGATAPATEGDEAAAEDSPDAAGSSVSGSRQGRRRRNLFFHDNDCQEVYDRLAAVAAGGQQAFTLPDPRPFWQQWFGSEAPYQDHSWRLLELSEVRQLYKDAQKRETLFKQHRKAQRQLEAAAKTAADREEAAKRSRGFGFGGRSASSNSNSGAAAAGGQEGSASEDAAAGSSSGSKQSARASSLDEFMLVSEVLKPLGETPRYLLDDSYAIITRDGSGEGPAAVATFNVYGSDHARLQGIATPVYLQRQGHATRLLQQLELVLAGAGVQDLVVILEPQDDKRVKPDSALLSPESAQHWFKRRLGFRPATSEAQMLWRRELPEYHKGLVGGCSLLVKPLPKAKAFIAKAGRGSKKA